MAPPMLSATITVCIHLEGSIWMNTKTIQTMIQGQNKFKANI